MPPPQSAKNTGLPSYSNVSCWMKCGGMISLLESLTKPESMGCWISACTSVISPLLAARTRMVDAMGLLLYLWRKILSENRRPLFRIMRLAAAAADRDLHFLVGPEQLAPRFDDDGHLAGLRHLYAVGDAGHRPRGDLVRRHQRNRICAHQERDRGDVGQRRGDGHRPHRAILGDLGRIELDLVGSFRALAVERLNRIRVALLLEGLCRVFVIRRRESWPAERRSAEADQRNRACALQDHAPRKSEF